ncbi:MAG: FAD-binding oxidoreductase [Verrucomicrobiota bacterium]|nr:FAD-binding oxidoreductase [Verrucomicrobiota bacterium]
MTPERVAIIGAGVSGLTCGVLFAEGGYHTEIFADEIGAQTTSGAAAAIWYPYDVEPVDRVIEWSLQTFDVLRDLSRNAQSGVSMIELRNFSRTGELEIPDWAHSLGARRIENGFTLDVPLTDTTIYLDYLATRFRNAGGEISIGLHFDRIADVGRDYSLVINCTGVGAQTFVPDPEIEPHRGQVVLVEKLVLNHAVVCDDPPLMYAIPRANDCVFGGSNEISSDRHPDPGLTSSIVAECGRILNIAPPKILGERVGLRPFRRSGICLRKEGRVIHNYGHGGSGFTLSWGCARAVLALASS